MKLNLTSTRPTTPPPLITTTSEEQQSAIDVVIQTQENLIVEAPAGSGKTFFLEALLCAINNHFPDARIATLSFNNKIETELQHRFSRRGILHTITKTAHKFGKRACEAHLGHFKIQEYKIPNLLKAYPGSIPWPVQKTLARLISLAKDAGVGIFSPNHITTWQALCSHHDIDPEEGKFPANRFFNICENVLTRSQNDTANIDIADLIYMPLFHNWPIEQYDFVLVDEAQDINAVRRELCKRMLKEPTAKGFPADQPGGRIIAVGDPHQAIYGFTGADHDALDLLQSTFSCTRRALTLTYRCSQSVTEHARKTGVPHIRSLPDAPLGSVTRITEQDFNTSLTKLHNTSAILCRLNAPLLSLAIRFIKSSIPCRIEGKDVGKQLTSLIWKLKADTIPGLLSALTRYRSEQQAKLSPWKFEALNDKITCLSLLASELRCTSIKQLTDRIDALFSDHDPSLPAVLTLSSIHKSKGLEWPTVYLLGRNFWMPSRYATQPWMLQQESNLTYVAITRAKLNLIEVDMEDRK